MSRTVVLANGELYVGLDQHNFVSALTYPYVGKDRHTTDNTRHRVGVWIDGDISWLDDGTWDIDQRYPHAALIAHTVAKNSKLQIVLEFDDTVDSSLNVFLRNIHVVNQSSEQREIRLFLHQQLSIGDLRQPDDTAYYSPKEKAIIHSHGSRVFAVGATFDHDRQSFTEYTVGNYGGGLEGTWRDADDGKLSFCAAEKGQVDSTIGFVLEIAGYSSTRVHYWLAAGESEKEAVSAHAKMLKKGVLERFHETAKWWHEWLTPAMGVADGLSQERRNRFLVSAMMLRAHTDTRGAVLSPDNDDTTLHAWPRVGAFAMWPLVRLGYKDEPLRFFDFCVRALRPEGYFLEKYQADATPGSSTFSRIEDDKPADPTALDQSAIVLFLFSEFYRLHKDTKILQNYYKTLILPVADYLVSSIDRQTGLPQTRYNMWNESSQSSMYATAVVHAALTAGADLAEAVEDQVRVVSWRTIADEIYESVQKQVSSRQNSLGQVDAADIFGSFIFGLMPVDSRQLSQSVAKAIELFNAAGQCGLAKYATGDERNDSSERWIVPTLWYAEYCLEKGDEQTAESIISWIESCASQTGLLPDKVVSCEDTTFHYPSVWSHAEYMTTLLDSLTESNGSHG